jgi:hypothetical protein
MASLTAFALTKAPIMKTRQRFYRDLLILSGVALLAGCEVGFEEGINVPRGESTAPVQNQIEYQLIANASLVRQDTAPTWPLGRYGSKAGADQLLAITNIVRLADVDPNSGKYLIPTSMPVGPLRVRFIERLWITIPLGTPMGQTLDLHGLDQKHLVGYERAEMGVQGNAFFIMPCGVTGKVTLVKTAGGVELFNVDVLVSPRDLLPPWTVTGELRLPLTPAGPAVPDLPVTTQPMPAIAPATDQ